MCGIIGYTGKGNAGKIMLDALELLEYRGYDSAGIALLDGGKTQIVKRAGRVKDLRGLYEELKRAVRNRAYQMGNSRGSVQRECPPP